MTDAPFGTSRAVAAAGLAGFCCMAAELTAVRLQAPHFGDSAYVWTNVIGVILAALAGGAWLGGYLSGRPQAARWLARLLSIAGLLLVLVPFVAAPLGQWLLPAELPLDSAMTAIVRGSLVATAVLFAPPMLLLGTVGPLLVALLARQGVGVGRAAGAVSAAGTLGSLAGTFAATHWLIPSLGCRLTMVVAGALLFLAAAAVVAFPTRRGVAAVTAGLLLVVLSALPGGPHSGPLRNPGAGRELLAERETAYQMLQVVRDAGPPVRTMLLINEGLDSYHSVMVDGSALTGGAYYDWHALAALLAGDGKRPAGLRALSIGDAAGSLRTVYAGIHPGAVVDGVDIDAACLELGREFFRAKKSPGDLFAIDGRVFVNRATRRWHVIHVDAYAHQVYVPAHLASREFFTCLQDLLEPGGVVACNVGALRDDDPVLRAIGSTVAAVFGHALALQVPNTRNFLLLARKGAILAPASLAGFVVGDEELTVADQAEWRNMVTRAAQPQHWRDVSTGGPVLRDDRPVLDELMMQSYVKDTDVGTITACTGSQDTVSAEMAAYEARRSEDWDAVIRAVAGSAAASAYLREQAGDARWSLRELHSAAAEYTAARALAADEPNRERLTQKLAQLQPELAPHAAADAAAVRNGWLAAGVAFLFAIAGGLLYRMSRIPEA